VQIAVQPGGEQLLHDRLLRGERAEQGDSKQNQGEWAHSGTAI
jgi:hypothetical protein